MANYKKLERDPVNRVIGGVCSGLAEYFCINISLIRVLFVMAFLFLGFGFWLYIVLWIVIPLKKVNYYFTEENQSSPQDNSSENLKSESRENLKKRNNGVIIISIIVIAVGLICLLNNFYPIRWLWRLWPIILIILGVMIIIGSQKNKNYE